MAKDRIDRRVARTRAALQQALMALIRSKGYDAITVQDICAAANVGRSTFYSHYKDVGDLKRSSLDDHLRHLLVAHQKHARAAAAPGDARQLGFSLAMFEHARDHLDLHRALVGGRGGVIVHQTIRQILADL